MLGTGEVPEIVERDRRRGAAPASSPLDVLQSAAPAARSRQPRAPSPEPQLPTYIYDADTPRLLATPRHYAYVKIAEGCDYKCAFCIIPTLRGALPQPPGRLDRPRSARARRARRQGAAAHLAGHDVLRHRPQRARRARAAAARAERGRRPRVDPPALPLSDDDRRRRRSTAMAECEKVCKYIDLPLQHASNPVLQAHEAARHAADVRHAARPHPRRACPASRSARPSSSASPARPRRTSTSCARSSRDHAFDHVGVFTYSHEEGTSAYALDDDVPAAIEDARGATAS